MNISVTALRLKIFDLVNQARDGQEITITVSGKPAARLVPCHPPAIEVTHGLRWTNESLQVVDLATGDSSGEIKL